jgi:hypothetical protein
MKRIVLPLVVAAALTATTTVPAGSFEIEEQVVGPAWEQGTVYTLSTVGMRVATMHAKGSRFVVTVDGVEGPPFDEILNAAGDLEVRYDFNLQPVRAYRWQGPVAFSPDGGRHAYVARLGKEVVVMVDGKEIHRAPYNQSFPKVAHISFSPDGSKLLFYESTTDTMGSYRLMMDGKPATPAFAGVPPPFFSPDGKRWGLFASRPIAQQGLFLLIDGKDAGYVGVRPEFTPDGKRVVSIRRGGEGGDALLVDGKPQFTAPSIDSFTIGALGDIAAIATPAGASRKQLYMNGKPVRGTEGAFGVVFSPDGKRWAAMCADHPSSFVVVDGKKQQDYTRVSNVAFTPDGSKCVYMAESGMKKFVVTEGEEDAGALTVFIQPVFAEVGGTVAYAVGNANGLGNRHVVIDGVPQQRAHNITRLALNRDGTRHAYFAAVDALASKLIVDGEEIGGASAGGDEALFSPDGRSIAAKVRHAQQGNSLYVNGEFISHRELPVVTLLSFTPDSRHVLTVSNDRSPLGGSNVRTYRLNGEQVAQFAMRGVTWANAPQDRKDWQPQPDGSYLFVGPAHTADQSYGPMTRVRVRPVSEDSNIDTWIASVRLARETAIAEAEAAKAKAEADRLAAIEARRLAAEEAAAARKKAAEEAAAARKKAAEDAAAARAKARAEAEAARKAQRANP